MTVLHFKTGDFAKFRQISSKIKIMPQGWFLVFLSVFLLKKQSLEPTRRYRKSHALWDHTDLGSGDLMGSGGKAPSGVQGQSPWWGSWGFAP